MIGTVWLASYPKSGNTWFRLLLANLGQAAPVDINNLMTRGGIASARPWFDDILLIESGLLTHEECDRLRPLVHAEMKRHADAADETEAAGSVRIGDARFIKTHDAYTINPDGTPLLAGAAGADAAILIVRDPRDVAVSLAHHNRSSIDAAITFMGRADACFCGRRDRQPNQLRQQLPTWSGFIASWLDQLDLPVHPVRYEDLQIDAANRLRDALAFAGIGVSTDEAKDAARFADFKVLREQEGENGFGEAPPGMNRFFRRGLAGGWREELTPAQCARIEQDHATMMTRLGYEPLGASMERLAS